VTAHNALDKNHNTPSNSYLWMKKTLLLVLALVCVASYAFAQSTTTDMFTFTPSTQFVSSNSTFTIQVGVTGSDTNPNPLDGYDLWLVTSSTTSSLFKITAVTYDAPYNAFNSNIPGGGDSFSTAASTGFNRNSVDLGNISSDPGSDATPPFTNTSLETLTISTGSLTPGTTYTFFSSTSTNAGSSFSDLEDQTSAQFQTPESSFTITTVPEPSTWFAGIGALIVIGYTVLRRRQAA
jgi:hypothetical protein